MNTLSYFLSTLRPSPPPSPRASTSEVPFPPSPSTLVTRNQPRDLAQSDSTTGHVFESDVQINGAGPEDGTGNRRPPRGETVQAVFVQEKRGEPPRIGVVPPSRKGSRKGKSRAASIDTLEQLNPVPGGGAAQEESNEKPSQQLDLPSFHDKSTTLQHTITFSPDRSTSWPFVARLARTWPFRFTASLYLLIRRFLSLFGLSHPPRPHLNSLLAPLRTEPDPDPEKSALVVKSTIVSVSVSSSSSSSSLTPPPSLPPSPSPLSSSSSSPSTTIPRPLRAPPRMTPKTLVLDLDETLIHSTSRPTGGRSGGRRNVPKGLKTTMVEVVLDGRSTMYTVYKRPWVDFFLRKVSSWYTVIIFTASLPEYADPVIDWLDGGDGRGGLIGGRLFRSHCLSKNGTYVKDLTVVDPDLAKVCLVDNSPISYAINQANGIPIEGWINDPNDECLLDLLPMLDSLRFTNDVRRVLGLRGFGKSSTGTAQVPRTTTLSGTKRNPGPNLSMSSSTSGVRRSE